MFRNYAITALRNLVRNRLYAAINIVGLALGFAAALLIALYVRDEFSYDRMFSDYQHIYLVGSEASLPGRATEYPDFTPPELMPLIKTDFPAIATIARIGPASLKVKRGTIENNEDIEWADPSILDIFKFKAIAGSLKDALADPNSIVLTRKMARKYFGRDDPVGETLEFGISDYEVIGGAGQETFKSAIFKVTAVIADLPSNTHFNINILAPAQNANSFIAHIDAKPPGQDDYGISCETYIKLPNASAAARVQNGLVEFMNHHKSGVAKPGNGLYVKLILRPIASLHLAPGTFGVEKPRGNVNTIYAMAAIGLLIMLAAGINFVNLMTARAMRRATEVGVRKAAGAARRDLIAQFIGEAMLYVIVGMSLGLVLVSILLPSLNKYLDRTIALGLVSDVQSAGFVVGSCLLVGILAGAYPAFVLASIRPAVVLRGIIGQQASSRIRQALVVLQFAVLIGLLIATGVVYRQTQFALTEAKRLNTDQVVLVTGTPCKGAFKEGLAAVPGVQGVVCSTGLALGMGEIVGPTRTTDGTYITMSHHGVGYGFLEFYGLKPIAGRFFSEDHPADAMPADQKAPVQGAVVLNETAVRRLGYTSAQDAVGKATSLDSDTRATSEIIGVVPDFAVDAVHQAVPPIVYAIWPGQGVLNVRIDGARTPETLAAIDKFWKEVGPPRPITRRFLDQRIAELYEDITRQGTLFAVFAGVAVSIAILGLFGMSASSSERRTREIGVRKAMGAGRGDVVRLLVWQFTRPVLAANLIAWPVGYAVMRRWLDGFAHHIALSVWLFLGASILAIVIAVFTVWSHVALVARTQPAAALRYE